MIWKCYLFPETEIKEETISGGCRQYHYFRFSFTENTERNILLSYFPFHHRKCLGKEFFPILKRDLKPLMVHERRGNSYSIFRSTKLASLSRWNYLFLDWRLKICVFLFTRLRIEMFFFKTKWSGRNRLLKMMFFFAERMLIYEYIQEAVRFPLKYLIAVQEFIYECQCRTFFNNIPRLRICFLEKLFRLLIKVLDFASFFLAFSADLWKHHLQIRIILMLTNWWYHIPGRNLTYLIYHWFHCWSHRFHRMSLEERISWRFQHEPNASLLGR